MRYCLECGKDRYDYVTCNHSMYLESTLTPAHNNHTWREILGWHGFIYYTVFIEFPKNYIGI